MEYMSFTIRRPDSFNQLFPRKSRPRKLEAFFLKYASSEAGNFLEISLGGSGICLLKRRPKKPKGSRDKKGLGLQMNVTYFCIILNSKIYTFRCEITDAFPR